MHTIVVLKLIRVSCRWCVTAALERAMLHWVCCNISTEPSTLILSLCDDVFEKGRGGGEGVVAAPWLAPVSNLLILEAVWGVLTTDWGFVPWELQVGLPRRFLCWTFPPVIGMVAGGCVLKHIQNHFWQPRMQFRQCWVISSAPWRNNCNIAAIQMNFFGNEVAVLFCESIDSLSSSLCLYNTAVSSYCRSQTWPKFSFIWSARSATLVFSTGGGEHGKTSPELIF